MKWSKVPLIIRETKLQIMMRYHLTCARTAISHHWTKRQEGTRRGRGREGAGCSKAPPPRSLRRQAKGLAGLRLLLLSGACDGQAAGSGGGRWTLVSLNPASAGRTQVVGAALTRVQAQPLQLAQDPPT